jgi:hypothetical protein
METRNFAITNQVPLTEFATDSSRFSASTNLNQTNLILQTTLIQSAKFEFTDIVHPSFHIQNSNRFWRSVNVESVHPFINSNASLLSVGFASTIKHPGSQAFVLSSLFQPTEHFLSSTAFTPSNHLLSSATWTMSSEYASTVFDQTKTIARTN